MFTQQFTVQYSYPVWFTRGAFQLDNTHLVQALRQREPHQCHRVLVVIDDGVTAGHPQLVDQIEKYAAHHAQAMQLAAPPVIVAGGEQVKNSEAPLRALLSRLEQHRIDRHSFVVAIGGGAVLDTVGLAAALCHRGVRLIRMPSTTLAQNDAGIGVKNGINAFGAKNFLGTFAPPFAVINDLDLLESLPDRDRRAGLAEAVKVALIRDAALFDWLCDHATQLHDFERDATAEMVKQAARLHLEHIAGGGDPFESGSARPLDFGHWAAHKLERLTDHALRHGEAVAIGIALDTRYSHEVGLLDGPAQSRIQRLLVQLGLPTWHEALDRHDDAGRPVILGGLRDFQEHLGGPLTLTMLAAVGRGVEIHEVDEPALLRALAYLREQS